MNFVQKNILTSQLANGKQGGMDEFELLAKLRRALEMSPYKQKDLCSVLKLTSGHLSQILSGIKPMYLNRLCRIADMVGYNVLLEEKGREVDFDMSSTNNPDQVKRLVNKIISLDSAGTDYLNRIEAYTDAVMSFATPSKKKRA